MGSTSRPMESSSSSSSSKTVINRTTVIQQAPTVVAAPAPVYVAPAPVMGAPAYDPGPGLGLAIGVSAINSIGNGMREARQEGEIARSRAELEVAKQREANMEQRLLQLERNQAY